MQLEEVDRLLQRWDERMGSLDARLVDLSSDSAYLTLGGEVGSRAKLRGVSERRAREVLARISCLFEVRSLIQATLERARLERARVSALRFWENSTHLQHLQEWLTEPSHRVPQELLSHGFIAQRASELITLDSLACWMEDSFTTTQAILDEFTRAWEQLGARAQESKERLAALSSSQSSHELGEDELLPSLKAALESVEDQLAWDPLSASDALLKLEERLSATEQLARSAQTRRQEFSNSLALSREQLTKLSALAQHLEVARLQFLRELSPEDLPGLPGSTEVDDLARWLERIEQAASSGRLSAALVGLQRWKESATSLERSFANAERALTQGPDRLEELRGRLQARQAQLMTLAQRGWSSPEAHSALERVRQALSCSPVRLSLAASAMSELERLLASYVKGSLLLTLKSQGRYWMELSKYSLEELFQKSLHAFVPGVSCPRSGRDPAWEERTMGDRGAGGAGANGQLRV